MEQIFSSKSLPTAEKITKPKSIKAGFDSAQWEVIGDVDIRPQFERQRLEVIQLETLKEDPLFKSFDGSVKRIKINGEEAEGQKSQNQEEGIPAQEVARLISQAEARGRTLGLEEAKLQRESELGQIEARLSAVVNSINDNSIAQIKEIQNSALEVALKLSKKIIEQAVEINPEYIIDVIKEGMAHAGTAAIKKIRVSKQDLEFIEVMGLSKKIKEFDGSWAFEGDDSLKSGCVIETSAGEVDFNLDRSWERIAESVVRIIK
jgi:flagellar assembly protein FliH